MTYTIIIPKAVQKQLDALPDNVYERIAFKVQQLAQNPRPDGVVKLKGSENEYRIRIGDYRVVMKLKMKSSGFCCCNANIGRKFTEEVDSSPTI
ncbi:type II toxin-antitoxin system RelE/ParE family toxin [Microcoleus sp. LEGE 07076]|uniref:type II toxin-antitoxin system RelE family toxin n=1 Tax=Microcoleus sp. LEGE 07076 TaxID=915322 RepID=UPI001D132D4F|nr:type II toxin-antitoxin system RelE/ParE family toxin [Microcoleus sp. LEGE 07076]